MTVYEAIADLSDYSHDAEILVGGEAFSIDSVTGTSSSRRVVLTCKEIDDRIEELAYKIREMAERAESAEAQLRDRE